MTTYPPTTEKAIWRGIWNIFWLGHAITLFAMAVDYDRVSDSSMALKAFAFGTLALVLKEVFTFLDRFKP